MNTFLFILCLPWHLAHLPRELKQIHNQTMAAIDAASKEGTW
jgi:hypothetical protein